MHTFIHAYSASARVILRALLIVALVAVATVGLAGQRAAAAPGDAANDHTVLILSTTVTGGASSVEASAAGLAGMDVEIATPSQWAAKTQSNFATYRALILGDPNCVGYDLPPFPGAAGAIGAAIANNSVWAPAVTGPVILIGTDEVLHGRSLVTQDGVRFAVSDPAKTGAFISLSCYYHYATEHTPLTLMNGFALGGFTVRSAGSCWNIAHLVATHPALTHLSDAYLSNWSCSVHEAIDMWPADWQVLAIAPGVGLAYTASDSTTGTPYILARGVTVISDITLAPASGSSAVGTPYTLTATVRGEESNAGVTVTFTVLTGPNAGLTLTGTTDSAGTATATYTGTAPGTDIWNAKFTRFERTQTSNTATVQWTGEGTTPTTPTRPVVIANSPSCGQVVVTATGVTPGLPHQIVVTPSAGGASQVANVTADASQKVSATFTTGGGSFTALVRNASNQVTVSNTAIFSVAACAVTTPAPTSAPTATPAPTQAPTQAPTPTPTAAPIANLPSTATGGDSGMPIALALVALALVAIAIRKRIWAS